MALPLAYRAARPSALTTSLSRLSLTAPSRHASLSAIHRGLLKSEKARPQGGNLGKLSATDGGKRLTYAERRKAREELAKARPTYKIRRGKKDITEYPDEPKPQSRRARFYDPNSSFGKKSLVYQLKAGRLGEELKSLKKQDGERSGESPFQTSRPRPDLPDTPRRSFASRVREKRRNAREGRGAVDVSDPFSILSADYSKDAPAPGSRAERELRAEMMRSEISVMGRGPRRESRPRAGRESRMDRGSRMQREPRTEREPRRDLEPRTDRAPRKDREPLSIPYTTAASQFLYGKAVVEAALRSSRRKLYHLYLYGGANRLNASADAHIQALARAKRVPVTILGEDGLRLLDKMASSRPHNGFVLEASPLPQPPLTALGPVPTDPESYAARPGFPITLGHQSAEDTAVNGTPSFIPAPSTTHRPLVLILDQVLDPGNLGAILRSASFLGASAVGITRKGSATLTPVALKASAGAAESMTLFSVSSLPEFLNASRDSGWVTYAAVAEGPKGGVAKHRRQLDIVDVQERDPLRKEPCVLLIGSEGEGLSRLVVKKADFEVNIPNLSGSTVVDSLNVSVAAALLCSAFLRGVAREQTSEEGRVSLW